VCGWPRVAADPSAPKIFGAQTVLGRGPKLVLPRYPARIRALFRFERDMVTSPAARPAEGLLQILHELEGTKKQTAAKTTPRKNARQRHAVGPSVAATDKSKKFGEGQRVNVFLPP